MELVVTVIHLLIALALVGVVLVQRSEGGGLGLVGGGSGGMGGFMTARGTANLLTRATAGLAAAFMVTSLVLAILAGGHSQRAGGVMDGPIPAAPALPNAPPAPPLAR
ncbi:MAG: preprotein translocase subunit SecG [Tagaea sp.]